MRGMRFRNFFGCCIRYWYYFVVQILLSYLLAAVVVEGNDMIGGAIDTMLAGEKVAFARFMGTFVGMTLIGFVAAFFKSMAASKFSIKVQTGYKEMVAKKLYGLQYRYFDQNGSGSVLNKVNTDISDIENLLNQNLPEICTNLVAMITYAVYVGQIHFGLLLLIGVCYPILLYFSNLIVKKVQSLRKVFKQKSDIITEISQDCVSGILVLRAFGAEDYFQEKLNRAADDLVDNEAKRVRITNNVLVIRRMLQWLPNILCAVYAYVMVRRGSISMGELVIFLMILNKFVDAYVGVPFALVDARENMVSVGRVEEILCEEDERTGTETCGRDTDVAVAFEEVSFSYVDQKEVLHNLSFQIKKNSNVAFVGDSGGGKSTIFHLLCGFYPCKQGCYQLYGRDIAEWDIASAREQMALVSQNVFLFPTTILENVRYGNLNATDEQIVDACKKARIHDFIMGLPEQYESIVGERGILLSGGERQRISIARAFLKNAPILLLDEPTSAVDVETEKLIQEAIFGLSQNRTCITIAHRLSTIQNADEIMVLKDGQIVEKGCHKELMERGGIYANMYGREEVQKSEEKLETKCSNMEWMSAETNKECKNEVGGGCEV